MAKRAGTLDRSRDWYKVLQVPRTASIPEIKASYRKLALKLHPDRNKDDPQKTAEFKIVNQAYSILSNEDTKNTYDFEIGIRYNANRRTPPPPNYRSVKFPPKPKHWKHVWDHKKHYDMHYGNGMYEEVLKQARRRIEKQEYQSPLGNGFSFSKNDPKLNHNPFSRSFPQQRRASHISIEYEESYVEMDGSTTAGSPFAAPNFAYRRHVRVMQELNTRRSQRHEQTARAEAARRNAPKSNAAFESRDEGCVIL